MALLLAALAAVLGIAAARTCDSTPPGQECIHFRTGFGPNPSRTCNRICFPTGGSCSPGTATIPIEASRDDVEEYWTHPEYTEDRRRHLLETGALPPKYSGSSDMLYTSNDLELCNDETDIQIVGLRFNNVPVPFGATIISAKIEFMAEEDEGIGGGNYGDVYLRVWGEASDNSLPYTDTARPSQREHTSESIPWTPIINDGWKSVLDTATTPDLAPIVSEIVSGLGSNWAPGNSMSFMIYDAGTGSKPRNPLGNERSAWSFDATIDDDEEDQKYLKQPQLLLTWTCNNQCVDGSTSLYISRGDNDVEEKYQHPLQPPTEPPTRAPTPAPTPTPTPADTPAPTLADTPAPVPANNPFKRRLLETGASIPTYSNFKRLSIGSSDLELPGDGHESEIQIVGLRFTNLPIRPGVRITSAKITFMSEENEEDSPAGAGNYGDPYLRIWGEATDNARVYSDDRMPSQRVHTSESIPWTPEMWKNKKDTSDTPDLSPILNEIVGRSGWEFGNDVSFMFYDAGSNGEIMTQPFHERAAESYEGADTSSSKKPAKLTISWSCPRK